MLEVMLFGVAITAVFYWNALSKVYTLQAEVDEIKRKLGEKQC